MHFLSRLAGRYFQICRSNTGVTFYRYPEDTGKKYCQLFVNDFVKIVKPLFQKKPCFMSHETVKQSYWLVRFVKPDEPDGYSEQQCRQTVIVLTPERDANYGQDNAVHPADKQVMTWEH